MGTKQNRYTDMHVAEAKRLRAEENLSVRQIAIRLGVPCPKVVKAWLDGTKPNGVRSTSDYAGAFKPRAGFEALTVDKSYVLGVLCGDGSVWTHECGSRYLGLCVTDRDFAEAFSRAVNATFGAETKVAERVKKQCRAGKVYVVQHGSRLVVEDLERYFTAGCKTETWRVPGAVRGADEATRAAFLRGFFDSEGGLSGTGQVMAWSTNPYGVADVIALLDSVGVPARSSLCKKLPPRKDCYAIIVASASNRRFLDLVGFSIQRKQAALRAALGLKEPERGAPPQE